MHLNLPLYTICNIDSKYTINHDVDDDNWHSLPSYLHLFASLNTCKISNHVLTLELVSSHIWRKIL